MRLASRWLPFPGRPRPRPRLFLAFTPPGVDVLRQRGSSSSAGTTGCVGRLRENLVAALRPRTLVLARFLAPDSFVITHVPFCNDRPRRCQRGRRLKSANEVAPNVVYAAIMGIIVIIAIIFYNDGDDDDDDDYCYCRLSA